MRTCLGSLDLGPEAVCLLTVPFLGVAAALPFLEAPTYGGSLGCCGPQTTQLVHSLLQSYDAAWVVVILLALGAAAVSYLAGIRPRLAAACSLAASTAAMAFALFEASDGGSRVLTGGWGLPNTYGTSEHLSLDFYVFLGAAAVAVLASVTMVVTSTRVRARASDHYRDALSAGRRAGPNQGEIRILPTHSYRAISSPYATAVSYNDRRAAMASAAICPLAAVMGSAPDLICMRVSAAIRN